jgi:hypothetical protein
LKQVVGDKFDVANGQAEAIMNVTVIGTCAAVAKTYSENGARQVRLPLVILI